MWAQVTQASSMLTDTTKVNAGKIRTTRGTVEKELFRCRDPDFFGTALHAEDMGEVFRRRALLTLCWVGRAMHRHQLKRFQTIPRLGCVEQSLRQDYRPKQRSTGSPTL